MEYKQILETIIKILENNFRNTKELKEIQAAYEQYKNANEKIVNNIYDLLDFTDLLVDQEKDNKEEYINLLETLKVLKNNKLIKITKEQEENIKQSEIYKNCIKETEKHKSTMKEKYEETKKSLSCNNDIKDIIEDLGDVGEDLIEEDLIKNIYNLIKEGKINASEAETLLKLIIEYNNKMFEKLKNQKLIEEREKISDEELEEIFKKYGFDYKKVEENQKRSLRIKGNAKNIEEVFQALIKYSIPFKENSLTSIYLLIKSDKNAIETIYNLSKEYNIEFKRIISAIPAALIHKSSEKSKGNGNQNINKTVSGSYEDFEKNIKLMKEIGYNIEEVVEKTISILTTPNKTLRKNIENLKKYGFPNNLKDFGFSLSGLKGANPIIIIDKFIELGELEYIKRNTSRLNLDKTSYIFTRLYFAKKYNTTADEKIITKKKTKDKEILTGVISKENDKTLDKMINPEILKTDFSDIENYNEILEYISQEEKKGYSFEISHDETIDKIERQFKNTEITYKFNDTIISRYKTQRIYSLLKKHFPEYDNKTLLLFSLTYESILSEEEYENIKQYVTKKEKTK